MCGICGFVDFKFDSSLEVLEEMVKSISHRGPDSNGFRIFDHGSLKIGFGHTRLSILDLSAAGNQPMYYNHLSIVYNGEIYNFKSIKAELEELGHHFNSECDTEVILHAFAEWSTSAVNKFIGMFAFAIFDNKAQKIFLFRDRAGVKPLFYYFENKLLLFGSELKAFHAHDLFKKQIDINSLGLYFQYGYVPQPHTIFKNTYKVQSGHYLEIDLESSVIDEKCYWDVYDYYNKPKLQLDEEEAIFETEELLKSAVNYRMVSDVPVGVFLSGGYDSSLVSAILQSSRSQKIKTFSIGFHEDEFNEAKYAKKVATEIGSDHHEYYCTFKEAQEVIPTLGYFYDEPFGDASSIPTILVSKMARESVSVALSADAGDEVFGGYTKYNKALNNLLKLNKIPRKFQNVIGNVINNVPSKYLFLLNKRNRFQHLYESVGEILKKAPSPDLMLKLSQQRLNDKALKKLILNYNLKILNTNFDLKKDELSGVDNLNSLLAIDYKTYLVDDILTKVDRATMSVSLEGREPLLDHRLIEWVAQLPEKHKINEGSNKYLLKKITHKYLPQDLMERPKMGFAIPIIKWFRKDLRDILEYNLSEERIKNQNIFDHKYLSELKEEYLAGKDDNFELLWFMIVFQMWYDKWMTQ